MSPRLRGKVTRWGARGYGFVTCPDLPRDAWCHARFVEDRGIDVTKPLPTGMELEFEPREVEGGLIQAIAVTRPGVRPISLGSPRPTSPIEPKQPDSFRRAPHSPVAGSSPSEATDSGPVRQVQPEYGLASRIAAERRRLESERTKLDAEAQALARRAETTEAQIPELVRDFDERISELQRERDRQVGELQQAVEKYRQDAEGLRLRKSQLVSASDGLAKILADGLTAARDDFKHWVQHRSASTQDVVRARARAVESIGEQGVADYEEIRRRLSSATDAVERRAYSLAENASREAVRGYAEVLDRAQATGAGRLMMTVVAADDPDGRLLLVAPITPSDLDGGDDFLWRIAAFLFDTAERAAQEMNAVVTIGHTANCLSVDLRPWSVEPELIEIAFREAWEARPTLSHSLSLAWEVVQNFEAPFTASAAGSDAGSRPASPSVASGGTVRDVACRLGLPLADLIASLRGAGLPFHDDFVDVAVEQSLRDLLRIETPDEHSHAQVIPTPAPPLDRSSPPMVAKRILTKLLRDERIGGRRTAINTVWGHHFADNEKDVAREVTRRLIKHGLLQVTTKPGGELVSIDPRRVADVQNLIELRSVDGSLFEGL